MTECHRCSEELEYEGDKRYIGVREGRNLTEPDYEEEGVLCEGCVWDLREWLDGKGAALNDITIRVTK